MSDSNFVLPSSLLGHKKMSNLAISTENETLDVGCVCGWVLPIKDGEVGKSIISDRDRCRRPVTVTDEVHKQNTDNSVRANRRVTQKMIFHQRSETLTNVFGIFSLNLGIEWFVQNEMKPHCSLATMQTIESQGFQVMSQPPTIRIQLHVMFICFPNLKIQSSILMRKS